MQVGSKLEGSYAMAMKIWIGRHKEAMKTIRELEDLLEAVGLAVVKDPNSEIEGLLMVRTVRKLLEPPKADHEDHDHA